MIHALVSDARTVRIFEAAAAVRSIAEIAVFHNEASHWHERDLATDRPGRTINGASRQHQAYEPTLRAAVRSRLRGEPVYRPPPSRKRDRRSTV